MSDVVKLVIQIRTLAGRGQEQVEAFERLAPVVRAEEGCLQYDLHRVQGDPDRYVLVEEWASRAALAAHDASAHMVEADAANVAFRAGPAEVVELVARPVA
ncbi:antibiotic biosynthesis monooxygenase [Streptomyces sp. NBC_00190]|uniref:putative quinol monooxygenase n=1 Tax=Streptomyces sp. NBC_00190 TaxID=2903634 RepID=UPI002E2ABCB9|nr:antibiotic biosynthesis monooxygenase family protein [Streptomyces sp. NBC_00190]